MIGFILIITEGTKSHIHSAFRFCSQIIFWPHSLFQERKHAHEIGTLFSPLSIFEKVDRLQKNMV
jgi:hypothetical protein